MYMQRNINHIYKGMKYWYTDKLPKHYSKWKKPDIKEQILYDSTQIKYLGWASP